MVEVDLEEEEAVEVSTVVKAAKADSVEEVDSGAVTVADSEVEEVEVDSTVEEEKEKKEARLLKETVEDLAEGVDSAVGAEVIVVDSAAEEVVSEVIVVEEDEVDSVVTGEGGVDSVVTEGGEVSGEVEDVVEPLLPALMLTPRVLVKTKR